MSGNVSEGTGDRHWGALTLFDPDGGATVRAPERQERGYWMGAPSVAYHEESFYLAYRVRRPIGLGRGVSCRIAQSHDGVTFTDIAEIRKEDLETESIERSALHVTPDGIWHLYISYLDPSDGRWRIDTMSAPTIESLDVRQRTPAVQAGPLALEGVKDPFAFGVGPLTYLLVNYVDSVDGPNRMTHDELHGEGNAFANPRVQSRTGLAWSSDATRFTWLGSVLEPGEGWDRLMTRGSSILRRDGIYWMLFDGRGSVEETYEDRMGIAVSYDMRNFLKVDVGAPRLRSAEGTHSLRYVDAVSCRGQTYFYYEYARHSGEHELRVSPVPESPRG